MRLDALSILGVIFALILFITAISAIILYLAFRIKETLHEEGKRGMTIVKIAFLIGVLFLAGGGLYYLGRVLAPIPATTPTPYPTPILTPSSTPTPTVTPLPPTTTPDETEKPELILTLSYPPKVRINSEINVSFVIVNPTEYTAHDVNILTSMLFEYFKIKSSTHEVKGNVIRIGDIPHGTVICSLELVSPRKPTEIHETVTLTYMEMSQPILKELDISVTAKPIT